VERFIDPEGYHAHIYAAGAELRSGRLRPGQFHAMFLEKPAEFIEGERFVDWWVTEPAKFDDSKLRSPTMVHVPRPESHPSELEDAQYAASVAAAGGRKRTRLALTPAWFASRVAACHDRGDRIGFEARPDRNRLRRSARHGPA
jgi:hypothetical protein